VMILYKNVLRMGSVESFNLRSPNCCKNILHINQIVLVPTKQM
jgi:hypothetical protein